MKHLLEFSQFINESMSTHKLMSKFSSTMDRPVDGFVEITTTPSGFDLSNRIDNFTDEEIQQLYNNTVYITVSMHPYTGKKAEPVNWPSASYIVKVVGSSSSKPQFTLIGYKLKGETKIVDIPSSKPTTVFAQIKRDIQSHYDSLK